MQVEEHEGPDMKEEMMDQLRDWYIKYREREGTFPSFPPPEKEDTPAADEGGDKKDAKGGKGDKKGGDKKDKKEEKGKGKKDGKGKGKGGDDEDDAPPPANTHFCDQLNESYHEWSDKCASGIWPGSAGMTRPPRLARGDDLVVPQVGAPRRAAQLRAEARRRARQADGAAGCRAAREGRGARRDVSEIGGLRAANRARSDHGLIMVYSQVNKSIELELDNLRAAFERDMKGKKGKKGGKGGKKARRRPRGPGGAHAPACGV